MAPSAQKLHWLQYSAVQRCPSKKDVCGAKTARPTTSFGNLRNQECSSSRAVSDMLRVGFRPQTLGGCWSSKYSHGPRYYKDTRQTTGPHHRSERLLDWGCFFFGLLDAVVAQAELDAHALPEVKEPVVVDGMEHVRRDIGPRDANTVVNSARASHRGGEADLPVSRSRVSCLASRRLVSTCSIHSQEANNIVRCVISSGPIAPNSPTKTRSLSTRARQECRSISNSATGEATNRIKLRDLRQIGIALIVLDHCRAILARNGRDSHSPHAAGRTIISQNTRDMVQLVCVLQTTCTRMQVEISPS